MNFSESPIKVAVIGSGAIAEQGYLPAASMVPNVVFTHLVDLDRDRAKMLADQFGIPNYLTDYREIFDEVDAVVVATPPTSHATISMDFLEHGVHVLCEKPLAMTVAEAKQMVAVADKTQSHLAVAMVRRLAWSAQTLRQLVADGVLGKISSFDIIEGWEFNWPLKTNHIFRNENRRGVIEDTGPHLFDLLLWILDCDSAKIASCSDDNWGGIEANAEIEINLEKDNYPVTGTIELSFTRRLRNTIQIYGETGWLEAPTVGAKSVRYYPASKDKAPLLIQPSDEADLKSGNDFALQLSHFADSIKTGAIKYVPANEAVLTMELIDACYQIRQPKAHSWEKLYLTDFFGKV